MQLAAQLYEHRSLIWKRSTADLRYRYSATTFGVLWTVLHPLALIATYSLVFGILLPRENLGAPFPIVLCAGLLPWLGLTECITRACHSFRNNRVYLNKLPVPESAYVGQAAVTASVNMAISLALLLVASLLVGVSPSWSWLLLPLPLLALMLLGFGVGLAVGTLNAFLPDVGEIVPVALRVGMWLVPVILPLTFYQDNGVGWAVATLPPTSSIHAVRQILVEGQVPHVGYWIGMSMWAVVACVAGALVLRALRSELRDVL